MARVRPRERRSVARRTSLAAELLLVVSRIFTRFSSDVVMRGLSATTGDVARAHTAAA
jgi:hypothetical protein